MADVKYRMQCSWAFDSLFPRDRLMINPCFQDNGATSDPNGLCAALATALQTWAGTINELKVKAYDLEGTKPVYPAGQDTKNSGILSTSGQPREVAVCLSFYSQRNEPRKRGRLYLPVQLLSPTWAARPNVTTRDKVMQLGPILASLGGVDVDWIVWSERDRAARKVSHYYVDDEWDVQRSRGLKPTTRTAATTSG